MCSGIIARFTAWSFRLSDITSGSRTTIPIILNGQAIHKAGDIGYATAEERERGCGHYVLCKEADEAAGTITLIEQNWIWNGQAGVNRTISYDSCYTFYTLTSYDGSRPEAQEPTEEEVWQDEQRATTGALPSAPISAAANQSAADVLGSGSMTGEVSDWAQSAVAYAKQWGILAGTSLNANAAITRGQFARLLVNTAYGLGDWLDLSQPQTEAARLGLMMGDAYGNFDADGTLTREMAAVVLTRLWRLTGDALASDESVLWQFADASIYQRLGARGRCGRNDGRPHQRHRLRLPAGGKSYLRAGCDLTCKALRCKKLHELISKSHPVRRMAFFFLKS